jgi:hypothetical protein
MDEKQVIRLDGSHGMGMNAHLTVVTSDKITGTREVQYEFPYSLIDFKRLQSFVDSTFILGYRIEKIIPADAKAFGIVIDESGIHGQQLEGE